MLTNFPYSSIHQKIIPRISFTYIFILFLLLISINSFQKNNLIENTLPTKYFEHIKSNYIEENANLYLISTKEGYLYALNNEKKTVWKTYLEQELISSNLTKIEISNNLFLYPYNEQIYVIKDEEMIPFTIYIKKLVEEHQYLNVGDFTLLGKTKTTMYIIDIENGEILQKIDDNNIIIYDNNKVYIRQKIRRKKTLTIVRVDYILNCININDEEKYWNALYSDIIIQKENENLINGNFFMDYDFIKKIINDYKNNNRKQKSEINDDNVITAYAYFDKEDLPNIKIFDKSVSSEYINSLDNKLQKYNNYNKYRRQNILPYKYDENYENNNINKISWNYFKNKLFLIIIIIILCFILLWIIFHKNTKIYQKNNKKNENTISFDKFEIHESNKYSRAKTISIHHKLPLKNNKKLSYDETEVKKLKIKKEINKIKDKDKEEEKINSINDIIINNKKSNSKESKSSNDIKDEKENTSTNKESKDVSEEIKKEKEIEIEQSEEEYEEEENNEKKIKEKKDSNNHYKHPLWGEDEDSNEESNEESQEKKEKEIDIKNEINENKQLKINNKKSNRLDTDFQNFEKIGEGGFGVVLKATHKIDKYIYAIKIINISGINSNKQIEDIVKETKKMSTIRDKHIVNYNICWYEDNLGTSEKFFNQINNKDKNDNTEEINYKQKKRNNSIKIKKQDTININDFNSNYCINYRDDSKLINNNNLSIDSQQKYFIILMEYCDSKTLQDFIEKNIQEKTSIKRSAIYNYIRQILKGLKALHKNGIIHSDIKPGNIFLKKVGDSEQIKIGDFGLSLFKNERIKGYTPGYCPPELINYNSTYNEKIDIYACGIILYELCACFENGNKRKEALKDLRINGIIKKDIEMKYKEESILIKMMTKKDYNERPSAEDILKSDIFKELGNLDDKE